MHSTIPKNIDRSGEVNYLKLAVKGLCWSLVLALATVHAKNAQTEAAASEATPVFAAQRDARLNVN